MIITPYAWDKEGRGMVVLDIPLSLDSRTIVDYTKYFRL